MQTPRTYTIDGRTFTLRTRLTPSAITFLRSHTTELERIKALGNPAPYSPEAVEMNDLTVGLFFPDEQRAMQVMRAALAGDHTGVDWFNDVSLFESLAILNDWLSAVALDAMATPVTVPDTRSAAEIGLDQIA